MGFVTLVSVFASKINTLSSVLCYIKPHSTRFNGISLSCSEHSGKDYIQGSRAYLCLRRRKVFASERNSRRSMALLIT